MNTVTLSTEHDPEGVALVSIPDRDRKVCLIGVELLLSEVEKAKKSLKAIGLDPGVTALREAEADALKNHLTDEGLFAGIGFGMAWIGSLRVALALEMDRVVKVQKDQLGLSQKDQLGLSIPTDETTIRIKQIDRLLSELDVLQLGGDAVS